MCTVFPRIVSAETLCSVTFGHTGAETIRGSTVYIKLQFKSLLPSRIVSERRNNSKN